MACFNTVRSYSNHWYEGLSFALLSRQTTPCEGGATVNITDQSVPYIPNYVANGTLSQIPRSLQVENGRFNPFMESNGLSYV